MEYYHHEDYHNITYVPIGNIAISNPIISAIKNTGGTIKKGTKIDSKSPSFGQLNRMAQFNNFLQDTYPPVVLSQIGSSSFYRIIDGRHRVASSIVNNMSFVPAVIH
tara:strand:- start:369 stop:689 length:321 start_codon:yes stop_codon:yes gene_type:complete